MDELIKKIIEVREMNHWLIALVVFICTALGLMLIRKMLWIRFHQLAHRTKFRWDDALLQAIYAPTTLFIWLLAIKAGSLAAPLDLDTHKEFDLFLPLAAIVGFAWALERVVSALFLSDIIPMSVIGNTRKLLITFLRILIISVGTLLVLDNLGVSITPILASLGVGSVAVALALQDTLSNFFSGVYLLADRPIRLGDYIKMEDDVEGHVVDIGWRSTRVKQLSNNVVVIPNSKIANSRIINFNLPAGETSVLVEVGVSYSSDLNKVEQVVNEVGFEVQERCLGAVRGFAPFIRFHTFADSSINFTVILRAEKITDQYLLKHEFIKALSARFVREDIEIPFPQRTLHVKNEHREILK